MKTILHTSVFKLSVLMLALASVALVVQAQAVHNIAVTDFTFSPDQLEIHAGDTVIWTNTQGSHNVNGTQATFASNPESFGNNVGTGWTFKFVFNAPGTYNYQCDPHAGMGMDGQITVSEMSDTVADITINFSAMNPHVGQDLWLALIDQESGVEIIRVHDTVTESFSVVLPDITTGRSYNIDFFADHNQNGYYNPPPEDHAWRIEISDLAKDTTLAFVHNTTFTDIEWDHILTIHFLSMTPHVGQTMWLNVVDKDTDQEIARLNTLVETEFNLEVPGIVPGNSYRINFFVDFNGNGRYDSPPTDHAWKLDLDVATGDTTLTFTHNTDFEDIEWENRLKIQFTNMNPHIGQLFMLYIFDSTNDVYVDTITVDPIPGADFDVEFENMVSGNSYNVDFFADLNGNSSYDAPPVDHAWRIVLEDVAGDTTIVWVHNTDFTNIFETPTGIDPGKISDNLLIYPNPAKDHVTLSGSDLPAGELQLRIFNNTGQLVKSLILSNNTGHLRFNINDLSGGTYHLLLENNSYRSYSKLVKSE